MAVLRSKSIQGVTDIVDGLTLCDEHNIPTDGLDTFEEIKDRLWMHYRLTKQGNAKARIQTAMQRTDEEDDKKRRRLTEMFEELVKITEDKEDAKKAVLIQDLLKKEHTSENLHEDCTSKVERLKRNECVILVAGETSAGKSSLLNLLLGKEYLPTHACSCTSTITLLKYGPTAYARIIYGGPNPREVIVEGIDDVGMPPLFDILFMRGAEREKKHDIKEVQVYLPSDFLKCGIVLADTPGIGENEVLEEYLMDFISQNEILGFVYIIMSDSAGGVQEDRLLMLLKMIINQQKENAKALPFDPKAAMFVANRFDAIPQECRDKIKKHILSQLEKAWPSFVEPMAVFFSTKKAWNDIQSHPDYINDDYKILLEGISNLFSLAMDRRIRSSFRWMETVLKRIEHFLKTTVTRIGWTQRENAEKSAKQRLKLAQLHLHADTVIKELMLDIDEKSVEIVKEVQIYLNTPQAQFLLCSAWGAEEIPKVEGKIEDLVHWEWVKQRIDEAFFDRLFNALEDYNDEKCRVSTIEAEIIEHIKARLGLLQEEIADIESDISATNRSASSNVSNGSSRYSTARRLSMSVINSQLAEIPTPLVLKLQYRVSKNPIRRFFSRGSKEYQKDPQQWAKGRSKKLLSKFLKDTKPKGQTKGALTLLIEQLLQRPREILSKVEEKIPSIIETNLALLKEIENHIINEGRNFAQYEKMMVQVEVLKTSLMNYGDGYIFVNDFKTNEVKVLQDTATGGSIAQTFRFSELIIGESADKKKVTTIPQGLWTVVRQGLLQQNDKENPISIRIYMPSSGVTQTFQEVAKLRCLLHEGVQLAKFLGIHHTEAVNPAYIFEGHFLTVESFFLKASNPEQHFKRVFNQIAEGLLYLHSKGMVHMELTSSTVTVTDKGEVRLTGASVPRQATLPHDPEQPVSNFVYLSPEVLRKELYITSADIYGFGLLVYEITGQTKAFKEQRSYSFKDFVERLDPISMLDLNNNARTWLTECVVNLVTLCVERSENRRPNMDIVIEKLARIDGKFRHFRDSTARSAHTHTPAQVFRMSRVH